MSIQHLLLEEIARERRRQDEKWGEQNHHPLGWFSIIGEEFGEMCKAFNEYTGQGDLTAMETEAIQVAACCVAMLECIERQRQGGMVP